MKYIFLITITLYVASHIAFAQKRIDKTSNGKITFKIKNAGVEVIGTLDIVDLQISVDQKNLDKSRVLATADPNSVNTGIRIRDNHLRRGDYFDADMFPSIKLESKSIARSGKSLQGVFNLTIKGITKPVVVRFTSKRKNDSVLFEGSFSINRTDFSIGEDSSILDEEVRIFFSVWQ